MSTNVRIFVSLAAIIFIIVVIVFYFVPAFRGDIIVSPDLHLGPVRLHWYGITMALAILVGFIFAYRMAAPRLGISPASVERALLWLVLGGFLGARLYYVAFAWDYFHGHLEETLAFWRGGLSIYGAIAGGAIAMLIYAKAVRISVLRLLDVGAAALPLAQAIGRFGNYFNYEAFGLPTSLPWKMFVPAVLRPPQYLANQYFHPAFLYEAAWDVAVFLVLLYLMRKKAPRPGLLAGSYLILYSLGRFWIEPLRLDSFFLGGIRVDQLAALIAMAAGAAIISITYAFQKDN